MTERALLLAGWGTAPARLDPLAAALEERGITAEVHGYQPTGTLDRLGTALAHRVVELRADRVHLVGHSLGGLVVAAAALRGVPTLGSVTTVNAPWRGTWAAYTGDGTLARALRWRATELAHLRDGLRGHLATDDGPRWLLLSALGDLAVPTTSALRVGARGPRLTRRRVAVNGHSLSLLAPRLVTAVVDHVTARGRRPLDDART